MDPARKLVEGLRRPLELAIQDATSNTNAASIMIGEKAADLILGNSVAEFRSLADGSSDRGVMRADRARGGELAGHTSSLHDSSDEAHEITFQIAKRA